MKIEKKYIKEIAAEDKRFFNAGGAFKLISKTISNASLVRIATAYFEPTGWNLLRDYLKNKEVRLLLGREENANNKIELIVDEFIKSINTGTFEERVKVIEELRNAIFRGKFLVNLSDNEGLNTLEPRYLYHHAKLYIADYKYAVVTSANFSKHGLKHSREAGILVENKDDVNYFIDRFDYYFNKSTSISNLLLEKLNEWLNVYKPYEIYMLSLLTLYGLPSDENPKRLPELAGYQKPVVTRIVRNIETYGGAMLVASTGLGKTIMAAHISAYLKKSGKVEAAIVLCPSGLKSMWNKTMRAARLSSKEFSYYAFSLEDWKKSRDVVVIEIELKHADEETIIILDESHHLRNSEDKKEMRLRHKRILQMIGKKSKLLLMTATPYSKDVDDINNQLMLIPKYNAEDNIFGECHSHNWRIDNPSELSELECGLVLTTPSVVKNFSHTDENNNKYVLFSKDHRKYFPNKIYIKNISYNNVIDKALCELLKSGLLNVKESEVEKEQIILFDDEVRGKRRPLTEAHIVHRFCSSLKEADVVLGKLADPNGFEKLRFENQEQLTKKAELIRHQIYDILSYKNEEVLDEKLEKVVSIINGFDSEKIVIFCVYKATAEYIVEYIQNRLKNKIIKTTVNKDADDLESIIQQFAPVANDIDIDIDNGNVLDDKINQNEIDILVATTAVSEGFNFQDASVMINFDLPWTVLVLAQRMGRILRPWHEPRDIYIFNLIASTMTHEEINHAMNWNRRLEQRNNDYKSFAEIPVMVNKSEELEMADLARTMERFGDQELDFDEVYQFIENADSLKTSSFIDDLAFLTDEETRNLKRLPDGIRSFKGMETNKNLLYLLINYRNNYFAALFNENAELFMDHEKVDDIMKVIRSEKELEPLAVLPQALKLDEWYNRSVSNWAVKKGISVNDVSVKCMMVIIGER